MNILYNCLIVAVGFVALIKGADYFVEGSAAVARRFKVPGVIIGLTVVAMGTSAPELAVSISAGLSGSNEIAVSNVVGSNIFNLLMVLGVCAVMRPLPVESAIRKRDFPVSLVATLLVGLLAGNLVLAGKCVDLHNSNADAGVLNRWNGLILLACFVLYLLYTIRVALKNRTKEDDTESISPVKSILFIVLGLVAIIVGGRLVVDGAKELATAWGMSETLVGLTVVAVGTSLPELVTSVVASVKGQNGMALGNVVGSNLFNLLLILGTSSTLHPIKINVASFVDLGILLGVSLIAYAFVFSGKKINRVEGAVMIILYAAYMFYAVVR